MFSRLKMTCRCMRSPIRGLQYIYSKYGPSLQLSDSDRLTELSGLGPPECLRRNIRKLSAD